MPDYQTVISVGEQIPRLLQSYKQWCLWTLQKANSGRLTKVPDQSTLARDSCRAWADVAGHARGRNGGVGFVTTGKTLATLTDARKAQLLFLDLDACRDPDNGELMPWAVEVIAKLDHSYTEISPSGTGVRVVVAVVRVSDHLRAKVKIDAEAAPNSNGKKPELQIFGLGPAGYVTMTGQRLAATNEDVLVLGDIDALVDRFGLLDVDTGKSGTLPVGVGSVPSWPEITAAVEKHTHGWSLIRGLWKMSLPGKSASEAYYLLVQLALQAANGHVEQATNWLLAQTLWGRGQVDDSRDPSKYARPSWVAAEVLRAAAKSGPMPGSTFEDLGPVPEEPAPAADDARDGDPLRVLDGWRRDRPLVHLPTGIETLDLLTGGGFVLGSRVYMVGAPDAGKTALAVQIADAYLVRGGITVGLHGIDEEPSDMMSRMLQRRGVARTECEEGGEVLQEKARRLLQDLPLRMFDGELTIERAAAKLFAYAKRLHPGVERPPCVLVIDSVQVARCEAETEGDDSLYKSVTQRVRAIRRVASRYNMLVISTSEMNRGAYKSKKADEQSSDMASAKESGAIEFSARVLLSLKSVAGTSDVVELRVVKNKHGLSHRNEQPGIFLRVDRDAQQLKEDVDFEPVDVDEQRELDDARERVTDAVALVRALLIEDLTRNVAMQKLGLSARRLGELRSWLSEVGAIVEVPGPNRAKRMQLVWDRLPVDVVKAMEEGAS